MSEQPNTEDFKKIFKGIEGVQTRLDEVEAKSAKLDVLDEDFIKKAADAACDAMEEKASKERKEHADAMEDKYKALEIAFAAKTGGEVKDGETPETPEMKAYKSEITSFFRHGKHPSDENAMAAVKSILKDRLYSATEYELDIATKDLLSGSGPNGGYVVPADRSARIIRRLFETSPLRNLASVETTTSDVFEFLGDDDEPDAGWVGEVAQRPTTNTADLSVVKIPIHELYAQPRATQKIIDDAGFDIEGWHQGKVERRFMRLENQSFVAGDGSRRPRGFTQYQNWGAAGVYERDKVEQVATSVTANTFEADDLINLQNSLLEEYQMNATWGMHRVTFTRVMQLKDSEGQYLLSRTLLREGADKMLLGSGVTFLNDMSRDFTTTNALPIAIADWREFYTIVDRFGIRVIRDEYTNKPYILFYTTKRTGGGVTNFQAGKLLRIAA